MTANWRSPPWWPTANLRVCASEACGDYVPDSEGDCYRCGLPAAEHGVR